MSEEPETIQWQTSHKPGFVRINIGFEVYVLDCSEAFELAEAIKSSAQKAEESLLQ